MKIYTSNERKLQEFRRFGLKEVEALKGEDLREVDSEAETVIIYKVKDAYNLTHEDNIVVEDTILAFQNEEGYWEEIVDIRWKINELSQKKDVKILWKTSLGQIKDGVVKIFIGETFCKVVIPENIPEDAFGFDPYLVPDGYTETVYQLEKQGRKDEISPRKKAVDNMLAGEVVVEREYSTIPEWEGNYQHHEAEIRRENLHNVKKL